MARVCKFLGGLLLVIGVAVLLAFAVVMARDDAYHQAALAAARNPGNVMYQTEFGVAQVRRAFEAVALVAGLLLAINGVTMIGLGVVAGRVGRPR